MPLPRQIERPEGAITFWVIFDHPNDFPSGFVLRPQFSKVEAANDSQFGMITERHVGKTASSVTIISKFCWFGTNAAALRALIPPGCVRIGPVPGDDPKISEVWME